MDAGNAVNDDVVPLESIHPGVSSLINQIGAGGAELIASRSLYSGIHAGNTYTPLGEDDTGVWYGHHISRNVFNSNLLNQVQDLEVHVEFNERVENFLLENNKVIGIKTTTKDLYAKYVIDASGKKSIAGKKLNFKRKFYSPPLLCWTGISEINGTFPFDLQTSHFIPGDGGWTWLAPQPPKHCSWTRLSMKGDKSLSPPDELSGCTTIGKTQFANMRWRLYRPLCSEGIILCGDAAGILDPAAGQGIFNALYSGIMAANTVLTCLNEPDLGSFHLASYDNWFLEQFEMKVKQLKEYYIEHGIEMK